MKRLHRLIFRMLPGPFLGWLGTLMFLLLMQFLIKYLPEIAGRGLPPGVIFELVVYNLAYMVVLAVPMSVLIGTMMVFGRLAETRSYVVVKSAGISPLQLIWPTLVVGVVLTGCMFYFNNIALPEANYRASNLWQDIRRKQPGFELQAGVFYEGLDDYSILVQDMPPGTGMLQDVLIYDYTEGTRNQVVIKARRGRILSLDDDSHAELLLRDGEIHRLAVDRSARFDERYERLVFDRFRLRLDLSDFAFERTGEDDGRRRSDRTMRTSDMLRIVDSLEASVRETRREVRTLALEVGTAATAVDTDTDADVVPSPAIPDSMIVPTSRVALQGLDARRQRNIYERALQEARNVRTRLDEIQRDVAWEQRRTDRYWVEIHKKFSIAVACLIFALIGAPLGLSIRRGGLGTVGGLSTAIFLFYWVTLVQGEKLADRGMLVPWVGMWAANLVMLALGLYLMAFITLDLRATVPLRRRVWDWLKRRSA